jgi:2-methylaconitate cis-trans-isomerase PrpF
MKPHAVSFVGVSASTQTYEGDVRIDGLVGVTARVELRYAARQLPMTLVPASTHILVSKQCVRGSVLNGNERFE